VSGDSHLADSDIGGMKRKPFSFASSEVARRLRTVHLKGQVSEIGEVMNSGVCRLKTQVFGVQSCEA
jgi:hypothetical protein